MRRSYPSPRRRDKQPSEPETEDGVSERRETQYTTVGRGAIAAFGLMRCSVISRPGRDVSGQRRR